MVSLNCKVQVLDQIPFFYDTYILNPDTYEN